MRGWPGQDRGGDIVDECVFAVGSRGWNFGGGSFEGESAAFHAESQARDSSVHGRSAEPVGFVRLQTGACEAGGQAAAAVGDWGTALRVHPARRGGDGAKV